LRSDFYLFHVVSTFGAIMRIQHVLGLFAAATLSTAALAEPSVPPSQATLQAAPVNTVAVQAGAPSAQRLAAGEARHMKGTFRLADGRLLVLSNSRDRLFAELDGKREELVPAGQNRFVARESRTRLAFDSVPFANEVVVSNPR
jgi:hypothetical protein